MAAAFNLKKVLRIVLQGARTSDRNPQHCVRGLFSLAHIHFLTPANQDRPQPVNNASKKKKNERNHSH